MSKPLVSIVMGSDSDLPVMREAAEILEELGIAYDAVITSAHRTPDEVRVFAQGAAQRGIKVIIAGAGGAAHLPGVIAAYTLLPVIGVPIKTSTLNGVDSLYSIVQMPGGIPVATMAINGAKNAGILAAQILALGSSEIDSKLSAFRRDMARKVEQKSHRLSQRGFRGYDES